MKKIFLSSVILFSVFSYQSCGNGSNSQDSVDSAKDMNAQKMDTSNSSMNSDTTKMAMSTTPVDKEDADFAVNLGNGGMTEIALSQLAQQMGTNARVKAFADMMVKDHTDAGDKLKGIASAKNVSMPATISNDSQKKVDDLKGKKAGKDFDKAYIEDMVSDHKSAVDLLQKEGKNGKDADLKSFAMQILPTVQMHLDSAQAIKKMW